MNTNILISIAIIIAVYIASVIFWWVDNYIYLLHKKEVRVKDVVSRDQCNFMYVPVFNTLMIILLAVACICYYISELIQFILNLRIRHKQ